MPVQYYDEENTPKPWPSSIHSALDPNNTYAKTSADIEDKAIIKPNANFMEQYDREFARASTTPKKDIPYADIIRYSPMAEDQRNA